MEFLKKFWLPILLAGAGVYFIFRKRNDADQPFDAGGQPVDGGLGLVMSESYPVKRGSKGEMVRKIQQLILAINPKALPKYGADGDFGSETEQALQVILKKKSIDDASDMKNLETLAATKPSYTAAAQAIYNQQSGLIPATSWFLVTTMPTTVYVSDFDPLSFKSTNRKGVSYNGGVKLFSANDIKPNAGALSLSIHSDGTMSAVTKYGKKYEFIPTAVAWKKY